MLLSQFGIADDQLVFTCQLFVCNDCFPLVIHISQQNRESNEVHGIAVQVCELKIVDHIIDFHFVWIGRIDAELCLKLPVLVELHGGKGIEPFGRGGDRIHFHFYFAQVVVERHFVRIVAQVHGTSHNPELADLVRIVKWNCICG